jgi:hypothetical protein
MRGYWKFIEEALDHTLGNSLWQRLCRKTDYAMNLFIYLFMLLDIPVRDGYVLVEINRVLSSMKVTVKVYMSYCLQLSQTGDEWVPRVFPGGKAAET